MPLNDWLKQDKYYNLVMDKFTGPVAREFFNIDYIVGLLENHREGKAHNMKRIWTIYSFIVWYENYFVRNGEAAA